MSDTTQISSHTRDSENQIDIKEQQSTQSFSHYCVDDLIVTEPKGFDQASSSIERPSASRLYVKLWSHFKERL